MTNVTPLLGLLMKSTGPHALNALPPATEQQRNAHVAQFILLSDPARYITSRNAVDRTMLQSYHGGWAGPRVLGDLLSPLSLAEQDELIVAYVRWLQTRHRTIVPDLTFNL